MSTDSIEQINLITKFESMPNELLMEIFEYYDLYSLYYSFSLLNSRISNIIYHCQVSVDFNQVKSIDFPDFIIHTLPKFNAKNIRSFHTSNSHQIEVLVDHKSLMCFTDIRSLSLNNIPSNIIEYMISRIHFSRLERVLLGKNEDEFINKRPLVHQFFNSNKYLHLRTYKNSGVVIEITSVSLIEYVVFSCPSVPRKFLNFLNQSPCLKYIKASLYFYNQYSKPLYLSSIHHYDKLTHLNLDLLGEVCMETTVYLFKCVTRLCHLKLNVDSSRHPQLADPIFFWEIVLCKYLTELKRLFLNISILDSDHLNDPMWNLLANEEKVIEQIKQSNYWSSHQWKTRIRSDISTFHRYAKFEVI